MAKQIEKDDATERTAAKHPYNALGACLEVGKAVADHGGRNVATALVTQSLKKAEGSSTFYQLAGSARCFGIIEGSRELSLTEAGNDYFFPQTDTAQRRAILAFLAAPPLFRMVLDRFDGQKVPRAENLSNIFIREGLSASWAPRAVAIFFNVLGESEVVDSSGYIRFGAEKLRLDIQSGDHSHLADNVQSGEPANETVRMRAVRPQGSTAVRTTSPEAAMPSSAKSRVYQFADGLGRLQTPYPLSYEEWESLLSYVENVLKPKNQEGNDDGK
jgi:hypothetical protein